MRVTFERRYAMAHRLRHSGSAKCAVPHGHNELVQVELRYDGGQPFDAARNMAADFADLKRRWHAWIDESVDHAFQLGRDDPLIAYFREHEPETLARVMEFPGDPTTEILCAAFLRKLETFLHAARAPYAVDRVSVVETPTNTVSLDRAALALFPALAEPGWWSRDDMSINDLGQVVELQAATRSSSNGIRSR